MMTPWLIIGLIGIFTVVLLVGYILRLQRRSRELERRIDYSKLKEWKDDDD